MLNLNSKLYIITSPYTSLCKVHEFNPINKEHKEFNINLNKYSSITESSVINDKIYLSSGSGRDDLNIYEFNQITGQHKIIINSNENYLSSYGVVINNKLYFSTDYNYTGKIYEYDPATEKQKIITTIEDKISYSSFIKLNNKIYFNTIYGKVYEYDPINNEKNIIINDGYKIIYRGAIMNNKIYFSSNQGNIYEYDYFTKEYKIIIKNFQICSPVFFNNKSLYVFSYNKLFKYEPLKLIKYDIINLEEQLKRGIYLYYQKQNYNSQIRNISNIDLNNLSFLETKAIKILSKPKSKILLPFYNYHEEKINNTKETIIYNSPDDEISEENTKAIEVQKGLSTTLGEEKIETKTTGHTGSYGITFGAEAELKFFGTRVYTINWSYNRS